MANAGYTFRDRAPPDAAGLTVLDFYASRYRHFSRERWGEVIAAGQVTVDGRAAGPGDLLVPGQRLAYTRPPWDEPDVPRDAPILQADEWMVAFDKPAGLPVVPGAGCQDGTLLSIARKLDPGLRPVHRLDRGTSGVLVMARTAAAAAALGRAFERRLVDKTYLARVVGTDLPDAFEVDVPVGPVPFAAGHVQGAAADGRPARTRVAVVRRDRDAGETVVRVEPETGRGQQIRIHLAWAGWPLAGEPLYLPGAAIRAAGPDGRPVTSGAIGFRLHAWRLALPHPADGRRVEIVAAAPAWATEHEGRAEVDR